MKIEIRNARPESRSIKSTEIPNGTIFRGRIGGNSPTLFIKIPGKDSSFTIWPLNKLEEHWCHMPFSYYGYCWPHDPTGIPGPLIDDYCPVETTLVVNEQY